MAPTDQMLLARFAQDRDGDSFAELVRRHSGMVYGVCRRVLHDRGLAEDAAQETFLRLLRHPGSVTQSLSGWLHRVAHHTAVDLVRREVGQSRRTQAKALVEDDAPSWASISPLFDEALQELPDESRQVLVGHYLESRSQLELSQELGISQPTVSRRLAAGVAQLRTLLIAKGVVATVVLGSLMHGSLCSAAPASLALGLGKLTLAGQAGLGAGAVAAKGAAGATASLAPTLPTLLGSAAALALLAGGLAGGWLLRNHVFAPSAGVPSAWRFVSPDGPAMGAARVPTLPADSLGGQGPARQLTLIRLPGLSGCDIAGVAIAPDWSLVVVGNACGQGGNAPVQSGVRSGFILRCAPDGRSARSLDRWPAGSATISALRTDAHGDLLILGENPHGADLGGGPGQGGFVAKFGADATQVRWIFYQTGIVDAALAADGDLVVLRAGELARYDTASGIMRWSAHWPSHGQDHAQTLGIDRDSGVIAIAGYSDANTGEEVFKQPYARSFSASGVPAWTLWDADPGQLGSGPRGCHLNADGWALRLVAHAGSFLLAQISTGGNTVLAHDAHDPTQPQAPAIHDGAYQDAPGFGFQGATPVTALTRIDARQGTIARQTWLSGWAAPAQASAWSVADLCADGDLIVAVGQSGAGCPQRGAWVAPPGGSGQHGAVAVFDAGMRLLQCGSVAHAHWTCAALSGPLLVVGGSADADAAVRIWPGPPAAAGGPGEGYLAVFSLDRQRSAGQMP